MESRRSRALVMAFAALVPCLIAVPAMAGSLFIDPKLGVGVSFESDGATDSALSLGLAIGYAFTKNLAADISYTRFIPLSHEYDNSTNLFGIHATLSAPLGPVTPYLRAGPGGYLVEVPGPDPNEIGAFFDVGAGICISPVPFVGLTVGVNYSIIDGQSNILEPILGFGISLF